MKLRIVCVALHLAMLPLTAADQAPNPADPEWRKAALETQKLRKEGHLHQAAEMGKVTVNLAKHFGPWNPSLADSYHLLASIDRDLGRCGEARANFAHALAIWGRLPDPNPHKFFNGITNAVGVLCECEDFEAAGKMLQQYDHALQAYRSGPLDEARLVSLEGVIAGHRKDHTNSESMFRRAIAIEEQNAGPAALVVALEHSNLAVALDKQNRHQESLSETQRAIDLLERIAPHHPSLPTMWNNAACALSWLGRQSESERVFQHALAVASEIFGEDNQVTAKIMLSYSEMLRRNKETPSAQAMRKKATDTFRRALQRDNGTIDLEEMRNGRR